MASFCSVDGCDAPTSGLGLCNKHYQRLRLTGTTEPGPKARRPIAERFWAKVDRRHWSQCWEWTGHKVAGYGRLSLGPKASGAIGAHRFSYELHHGPIPPGLHVMHKCDNPSCVNPHHLSVGTPRDNTQDMIAKNRHPRRSPRGEASGKTRLTEADIIAIRTSKKSYADLAREYGVKPNTIRGICAGRTWSHVKCETVPKEQRSRRHASKLDERAVRAIRAAGGYDKDVAARFGVSRSMVTLIRNRKAWAHVS